jgi:regulator of sigma E protease
MIEILSEIWNYLLPFLGVLTALVFVHEMGHYILARLNGVRVEAFAIGFGPELLGWTDRSGTRWKFCAVPLGGYVKMFGDRDGSSAPDGEAIVEMTAAEKKISFHHKRLPQRAAIVAAGPIANFLFAIVIFATSYMIYGQPTSVPEITTVEAGGAADKAGLEAGDRILSIDGRGINRFEDVQLIVHTGLDAPLEMTVLRDGAPLTMTVVPRVVPFTDDFGNKTQIGELGVRGAKVSLHRLDFVPAVRAATRSTYDFTLVTLRAIGQFITGTRSTTEMTGPIGIAKLSGDLAQFGMIALMWLTAILSINLGLINLFPVPILDGGHLLFYLIEAVRRRPLALRTQEYGFRIGLGLVVLLMVFVTWNDLTMIVSQLV